MDYLSIKFLHVSCVVLSVSLFVLRGGLQLQGQPWRQWRLLRWAPHGVDTVLLSSAIWLAWRVGLAPWADAWLAAKVLGLLVYIALGKQALSVKTPAARRPAYFVAALLSVSYIIGVALTRSPHWGLL